MHTLKRSVRPLVPAFVMRLYHLSLAHLGALMYGYPSHQLIVIGVTGTKGKSSTTEMVNAMFEEAGYKTALMNSIRFKVADKSRPNLTRMSMPGRFSIQRFFASARNHGCEVAIIEMTSEGAAQGRHRAIALNALIFTNLSPEHIESHGSYEAYADAKFEIAKALARSPKRPRVVVANAEDPAASRYITLPVEHSIPFSLASQKPYGADEKGGHFRFDDLDIVVQLPGEFSLKNALAATLLAHTYGIATSVIASALNKLTTIPGRAERIDAGQQFGVVVDYAHTPDSLIALFDAYGSKQKICVMGATGGGRDLWKRPVMGKIADERCDHVILTNEDPYDEDPRSIIESVARGMQRVPEIVFDRRAAIARAIDIVQLGTDDDQKKSVILITGKGTDPNIAVANGKKIPWSDAKVAREELSKRIAK
jgi:UDP-N-acetylmuramoyl-L-alanyl-D-glutamate--2,6-diaminopimelate ligase